MRTLTVNTKLQGKEEVFKIIGLAFACQLPLLLVGPPGVGKTEALLEFMTGLFKLGSKQVVDKPTGKKRAITQEEAKAIAYRNSFILETDEGTKSVEVKGRIDMKVLTEDKIFAIKAPIVNATAILINEIDKANSGLRASFYGIMNEKMLFNGQEKLNCKWKLFVGSCNKINKDDSEVAFWDRFVIKHKVNRVSQTKLMKVLKSDKAPHDVTIDIPSVEDIISAQKDISDNILQKFIEHNYKLLTDRTMTYVPKLIAAASFIFKMDEMEAAVKVCQILTSEADSKLFADSIQPPEISQYKQRIKMLDGLSDYDQVKEHIEGIQNDFKQFVTDNAALVSSQVISSVSRSLEVAHKIAKQKFDVEMEVPSRLGSGSGDADIQDNGNGIATAAGVAIAKLDPSTIKAVIDTEFELEEEDESI